MSEKHSLLSEENDLQFGRYSRAFERVNITEARRIYNKKLPRFIKNLKLKEWQAFQTGNQDYFIFGVLYNAKFMALAQFAVYDIRNNKKYFFQENFWPSKIKLPENIYNSDCSYFGKKISISISGNSKNARIKISANIKATRQNPEIRLETETPFHKNSKNSSVVVIPLKNNGSMYSHKAASLTSGFLKIGKKEIDLSRNSYLIFDDHKGYYPYPMRYNWGTAVSAQETGFFGFNLTENQSTAPEKFNENILWQNNRTYQLPAVEFRRPQGIMKPWTIKDKSGKVNLRFQPVTDNRFKLNMGIIRADYHGPYGYFDGKIEIPETEQTFSGVFGMGEKKIIHG